MIGLSRAEKKSLNTRLGDILDLGFNTENRWFRVRACAVIVRANKILMCKNECEREKYYYSVGGGVQHGESIEDAIVREVYEETGKQMEIDRLLFIHQNFFNDSVANEMLCHEIAFYFLMKDEGGDLISKGTNSMGYEEETVWLTFDDFKNKEVYPKFLPEMLDNKEVKIITSRE